jgi:hypothetical protein
MTHSGVASAECLIAILLFRQAKAGSRLLAYQLGEKSGLRNG